MVHSRLKIWLVAASAVLSGLAAFLYGHWMSPVWEVRATILAEGTGAEALPGVVNTVQFSGHIQELTDFSGQLTAKAIPGTRLVVIVLRDDTPAHAAAGRSAVLDRLDAVMPWVGDCHMEPLLLSDPVALPGTGSAETCLAAALAGGLLAALLLFPLPSRDTPLDLMDLLRRWGTVARRHLAGLLIISLLCGGGNYIRETLSFSPVYTAATLVSIGEYSPDAAKNLSATVYGLLDSDLMTVSGITAAPVGQSNLFSLTAVGHTPEAAEDKLAAAIALWPKLAIYADRDLTILQRQPLQITAPQSFRPLAAWGRGILLGTILWAGLLFLSLLIHPEILTPPLPKRIISPKVKEGSP